MRASLAVGFGGVLAAFAVTCASPTEIVVDVYTEVDCGRPSEVAVTVASSLPGLSSRAPTSTTTECRAPSERVGRVVLSPSGDKGASIAFQVVTRTDDGSLAACTGDAGADVSKCIVARRQLRFVSGASTRVRVDLRTSCAGVTCDDPRLATCVRGTCVSALLPDDCLGGECLEPVPGGERPVGDAATPDGAPPDADIPPEDGGPRSLRPVLALAIDTSGVRGLAARETTLFWVDVQSTPAIVQADARADGSLAPPASALLLADLAHGLAVTETTSAVAVSSPPSCAHDSASGSSWECPAPTAFKASGIAPTGGGSFWLGGSTVGGGAFVLASAGGTTQPGCQRPSRILYMEPAGGLVYWTEGDRVFRASPTQLFGPCLHTAILDWPGANGLAVDAARDLVCVGSMSNGILCNKGIGVIAASPTTDLAFVRPAAGGLDLYFGDAAGIQLVRLFP